MEKVDLCRGFKETRIVPTNAVILRKWKKRLPERFTGKSCVRLIPNKYGSDFKVLFNKRRAINIKYQERGCPFNRFLKIQYFTLGDYVVTSNSFPFAKNHRLIITKKHYAYPKLSDFKFILRFSGLVDSTIILSLKGSGAGIPSHLHFQVFDDKMPVMGAKTKPFLSNNEVNIERIIFPSYGIKITGKNTAKWLFKITKGISNSYNLVIRNEQIILYPRTIVCPMKNDPVRFGATELSGFVITRHKKTFKSITKNQIENCLRRATLFKSKDIKRFETELRSALTPTKQA